MGGRELALANECGKGIADSEWKRGVPSDMYGAANMDMYGAFGVGSDATDENKVLANIVMGSPATSVPTEVSKAGCG